MTNRIVQVLLLFVAVSCVASKSFSKSDEFTHQQIMKLLSLPQKSEMIPNVFKVKIGDKAFLGAFTWCNCNSSAPLKFNSLSISPDPVKLSGDLTVAVNGTADVNVVQGLSAKLVIKKKIAGIEIEIPCESNIGSCTYNDVCSMIPSTPPADCPAPLPTYKIPCSCPVPKGNYVLPKTTFTIPPIPVPGWLASGDYSIGVKAYDKAGNNLACYNFKLTLA
ncbi:ganglioside GM2 activator-like [Amphiura filiformis]|uniref:ganglioside GM2 activator-like n=1 Tax=Amphiura filiformis TaxID=82378 RepID=UPI003B228527